jgi:hypothetical protein
MAIASADNCGFAGLSPGLAPFAAVESENILKLMFIAI